MLKGGGQSDRPNQVEIKITWNDHGTKQSVNVPSQGWQDSDRPWNNGGNKRELLVPFLNLRGMGMKIA